MSDTPDSSAWWQVNLDFPDRGAAEHVAIRHLVTTFDGLPWFLIRKGTWRCRIRTPQDAEERTTTRARLARRLDELTAASIVSGWSEAVYEAETRAFGGQAAMDAAHTLFCADTHHALSFLAAVGSGRDRRREVSLLLCRTLMRAAELDHYEQGDVWDRVAATRPLPSDESHPSEGFHHQVQRLLSVDPGPHAPHFAADGAFAGFAPWAQAFQACGRELAALHTRGGLERGLRAVLTHHVLFHWNRLGVPGPAQATLAHAAARVVFDPETVRL